MVGLLLIACLAQATIAASDGAGNETADQVVITITPGVTVPPVTTENVSADQVGVSVTPVTIVTPDVAVNETGDQVEVSITPVATPSQDPMDNGTGDHAVVRVTPETTNTPEVTVNGTVDQVGVIVTPEATIVPVTTGNVTGDQAIINVTPVTTAEPDFTVKETGDQVQVSIAPVNPAFTYYLETKNLPRAIVKDGQALGIVPSPVDLSHLKGAKVSWAAVEAQAAESGTDLTVETADIQANGFPITYDLRALGRVSGVRDQGDCGSCWAFAAYGSLESGLLPGQTWDFSENNMLNNHLWDPGHCEGGNANMAMAYLARWAGPVNEKADPYGISAFLSPPDLRLRKHAQEMFFIPGSWMTGDTNNLKTAIMNYGGVYSLMYMDNLDPLAFNAQTSSYYLSYEHMMGLEPWPYPNHAITLVGWDDTYDKNNFAIPAFSDGAFIAKNSWGTDWGANGYFYISYDDFYIGQTNIVFTAEAMKNYRHEYQWDELGWVGNLGVVGDDGEYSETAWFANVFTAEAREEVAAVSFYTPQENSQYTAFIFTDPSEGPVNEAGWKSTKSGSLEFTGYHTVKFDTTVPVNAGQQFSIVVKVTTPGYPYPVPVEAPVSTLTGNAVAHSNESYVSVDGSLWKDTAMGTGENPDLNVCLKAFTVPPNPPPDARFTAAPKKGILPLKVYFKDRSLRKPISWLWDFGDGQTSTERNPVHVYMNAGTYTVTLTVKNSGGEDSIEKEHLITVSEETRKIRPHVDHIKKGENPDPLDDD